MSESIRRKLDPEVLALAERGKLPALDCEWIANLPRDQQLAAAEKCINGNLDGFREGRIFKGKGTMRL